MTCCALRQNATVPSAGTDYLDDPGTLAIVQSMTALAHALGKRVTAEGVETSDQVEQIRAIGCVWVQGYDFARPLPPRELVLLLDQRDVDQAIEHAA